MKRFAALLPGLALLLLPLGPAIANTEAPGAVAASQRVAHPQLPASRLQGEAGMQFLGLRIYQARLWVAPGFEPDRPLDHSAVLELSYERAFGGRAIARRSLQEMRRSPGLGPAQAERWLEAMEQLFPDVRPGERLTGLHQPGKGMFFWHEGRPLGAVEDAEFGRRFMGIWLAPTTSEPALRTALLGLAATAGQSGATARAAP